MPEKYHMIKYIHENADALQRTLDNNESSITSIVRMINEKGIEKIIVTGVGSSYSAALIAAPMLNYFSRLPIHILPVNEIYFYRRRLLNEKTLVFIISRSGERVWVVNTMKYVIKMGAYGITITGVEDSLLAQTGHMTLLTGEGPEITYPKTKSVIACTGLLMRLALATSRPDDDEAKLLLNSLRLAPNKIRKTVEYVEPQVKSLIPKIKTTTPVVIGGTASNHGVAFESATKLQEATFIPSYGENTIDLLYGPLSPLSKNWLLCLLVTPESLDLSKELLHLAGNDIFKATRLIVASLGVEIENNSDFVITIPVKTNPLLSGLVFLPPMQLLAFYWTIERSMNPDAPSTMRDMLNAFLPPGREEPELRKR